MSSGLALRLDDATPAVIEHDTEITRGELAARADALRQLMHEHSVSRALVQSDSPVHLLRAIDACSRSGADLFIAHTNLPPEVLDEICANHHIQLKIGDTDEVCSSSSQQEGQSSSGRILMMTSGTTGKPKIAIHTLASILGRIRAAAQFGQQQGDKWLLTYQPTGFAGLQVILTALLTGGAVVAPKQRTPSSFFEAARRSAITQISGTPTFWRSLLMVHVPGSLDLKQITLGGEAVDQVTLDRLKAAFPKARVTHIYASTEAGVVFAVHDGIAGFPRTWLVTPTQGVQLRINDGFLQINTANVMGGYLNAGSQPLLEDGWLATADKCEVRGERVHILGREDSTINVAGSKVYPLAIESVLLSLPFVTEAKVYGVRNPISGQLVAADVVVAASEDRAAARSKILEACRARLAGYQLPRILNIVDAIAVGASGKKG